MVIEDAGFIYDKLNYFGEDVDPSEIERRGRDFYDHVRVLFDTTNNDVRVEYWEPDLELKSLRPADRARVIRGEIILEEGDIISPKHFGSSTAKKFFKADTAEVFIMIFPQKGYIFPEDAIEVRIKSKGSHSNGYGGVLLPNGIEKAAGVIPSHLHSAKKFNGCQKEFKKHTTLSIL